MKHEWLAEELRKIAHGCDVTGIRGSQHIRHAADLLAADVNKLEAENEALREHNAPMIDCLAGKLTSYDQIFGYLCKLEMENEALRAALESIASCNPLADGDVVEIAREALEREEP